MKRAWLILLLAAPLCAQTPQDRYRAAKAALAAHSDGFLTDDSPAAVNALQRMWSAIADFVIDQRTAYPAIPAGKIDHALCLLTFEPSPPEAVQVSAEDQCQPGKAEYGAVLDLAKGLMLVAPSTGEIGTVFLIGLRDGKPTVLWSIAAASPQAQDPHDLIGAWRLERSGSQCRQDGSPHKAGSCGPLYASLGPLPPDAAANPRFYIDAGYAQGMGGTIGHQTSIWVWKQNRAELLWIDFHDFMIDQSRGTDFHDGILSIVSKSYFRTFSSCGSCEERQLEHDILLEPARIRDLGSHSLVPELDLIDTLFWRIAHHQSTAEIATPAVAATFRPILREASKESEKIEPGWFTTGMLGSTTVTQSARGAKVCFEADEIGQFTFTLRRTLNAGYFITRAKKTPGNYKPCAEPSWLP